MKTIVSVNNLVRIFDISKPWLNRLIERLPKAKVTAVSDVCFDIKEGQVYALVGESGSGKSTIGKIIVGLLAPTSGSVKVSGVDLASDTDETRIEQVRSQIQMIFQDPFASLNPRWRVKDIINEPVAARRGSTDDLAERLLRQVGLSADDTGKYPHEFSGGQRQRICIARALASEPKLIVCDEPTSALDVSVQAQVLNLMSDLREEFNLTYLLISHDLTIVEHLAETIGVLYLGQLVEEAPKDKLFSSPRHPYTKMLLDAAPKLHGFGREADIPKGEIPDPVNPPSGCVFNPRCPLAVDQCKTERPTLRNLSGTKVACHLAEH